MWVSLILLIVLVLVTIKQGSGGLFNALMTAMFAICCVGAAFGTYEWVANNWLLSVWPDDNKTFPRDLILPLALALTFGVPLLVLRLVSDRLVRRPLPLSGLVDRLGATICGLVTALIMVGIVAACLQMIPFGTTFLGYSRMTPSLPSNKRAASDEPPEVSEQGKELLFGAARFAPALASVVSDGIFNGSQSFYKHHPDVLENIGWVGSVPSVVSRYAPPDSISVVSTEPVEAVYQLIPGDEDAGTLATYKPMPLDPQNEFRMVRVQLKQGAKDVRKTLAFALRQFRLVGQVGTDGVYEQHAPIAIQQADSDQLVNRHVKVTKRNNKLWPATADVYTPRADHGDQVEVVFEVAKGFKPLFIEFKREARASFSFDQTAAAPPPGRRQRRDATAAGGATPGAPPTQPGAATTVATPTQPGADTTGTQPPGPRRRRGSRAVTAEATSRPSVFSDQLPMALRSYQPRNAEISGEALSSGHLSGEVDAQANGTQPPVTRFTVPSDKRLLQLSVARLQAGSTLGRAMSRTIEIAQTYRVTDQNGGQYPLVGKWAIATVRSRERVEIQYFPPPSGMMGGLGPFSYIQEPQLTPQNDFVLLFLVNPGVQIVSFSSGGPGEDDNLTTDNLIAPQ